MSSIMIHSQTQFFGKNYWKKLRQTQIGNQEEQKIDDTHITKENCEFDLQFQHQKTVVCAKYSKAKDLLATACLDKIVRIFSIEGELKHQFKNLLDSDRTLTFSQNGKFLACAGSYDKIIKIWNIDNQELELELKGIKSKIQKVTYFNNRDDRLISITQDNQIQIWDIVSQTILHTLICKVIGIVSIEIFHDDSRCVIGSLDGIIMEWDLKNFKLINQWKGHQKGCFALKYANGGHTLVSGGGDKKIKLWNMDNYKLMKQFNGHNGSIYAIEVEKDTIISCQFNQTLVWNLKTLKLKQQISSTQLDYCFVEMMKNSFVIGQNGVGVKVCNL